MYHFGKEEMLVEVHVKEFQKLVIPNVNSREGQESLKCFTIYVHSIYERETSTLYWKLLNRLTKGDFYVTQFS